MKMVNKIDFINVDFGAPPKRYDPLQVVSLFLPKCTFLRIWFYKLKPEIQSSYSCSGICKIEMI